MSGHPSVSSPLLSPVRYTPALEQPAPDEAQVSAEIDATLAKIRERTWRENKQPLRSVHAKSHGLLIGELTVRDHLPPELAQGLFARPGRYPVVMRLSTTPGDVLEDSISTPRGLAIKVIGVAGDRVEGSEGDVTQDFVLINSPVFRNPKGFLQALKLLEPTTNRLEAVKKLTSAIARGAEAVIETAGVKSTTLTSLGGQQETHILGETFYSAAPLRYGAYMAKLAIFPHSDNLTALAGKALTNNGEPDMLRNLVVDFFLKDGAGWEIRVQLCTDLARMPIEDASIAWPEAESPYIAVGQIDVPRQDAWNLEKIDAIENGLAFSPWHALAAHRPLGALNRARKPAYAASAGFRASHSHSRISEPRTLADVVATRPPGS